MPRTTGSGLSAETDNDRLAVEGSVMQAETTWLPDHPRLGPQLPTGIDSTNQVLLSALTPRATQGLRQAVRGSLRNAIPPSGMHTCCMTSSSLTWNLLAASFMPESVLASQDRAC